MAEESRHRLLRQLEGRLRNANGAITDIRRALVSTGMTQDDVRAFEHSVRRRIREERSPKPAPRRTRERTSA